MPASVRRVEAAAQADAFASAQLVNEAISKLDDHHRSLAGEIGSDIMARKLTGGSPAATWPSSSPGVAGERAAELERVDDPRAVRCATGPRRHRGPKPNRALIRECHPEKATGDMSGPRGSTTLATCCSTQTSERHTTTRGSNCLAAAPTWDLELGVVASAAVR